MPKPVCGSQGAASGGTFGTVLDDLFVVGGAVGTAGSIAGLLGKTAIVTIFGISAAAVIWIAAVAAALATWFIVFDFYRHRCLASPDTRRTCTSGVVNGFVMSFSSTADEFFPYTAMHDRADIVVKSVYWPIVEVNAGWVHCSTDADESPILRAYYHDPKVCGAGLGATIGGGIGAVAGILAAVAIAAAIGCATIILCLIAILVAIVVAAIIVLVAALIGGQIGRAAATESAPSAGGTALVVGDYVTTKGGLLTSTYDDGARVYWFVTETTPHGRSTGSAPFSFTDPDANLPTDAC